MALQPARVNPSSHPTLLPPSEFHARRRPPLGRRLRGLAYTMRHDGRAQFAVIFVAFVLVGTMMMNLLEGRNTSGSPFTNFFNDFWFTVVTMTTVGYGDMAPTQPLARLFAVLEMFVGVGLVGAITGAIASALVEGNRRRAMGLEPASMVEDHIVVCGWKPDMREILLGILRTEPTLTSWELVLVNTHPPNEIGDLRREPRLRGLHYVYGNHTERSVLEMAGVQRAQRVIVLADESDRRSGAEPDSRTVLAATAVEAITREVYTCTEIVQPHFVDYLRPAGVEEVVLGTRNARSLLVSASLGDGMSNVMSRVLPERGQILRVLEVPPALVGGPYGALAARAREQGYLPLGLLDNTGSLYDRKQERIAEALRQPDYRRAVEALTSAARLKSNVPTLAPGAEHPLRPHAKLVVLLPTGHRQAADQMQRRQSQRNLPRELHPEHLLVCGWKPDMAELLAAIVTRHEAAGRPLAGLSVAGSLPEHEADAITHRKELAEVTVVLGEPTDPQVLRQAGVLGAQRVLILSDPLSQTSAQEADARSVMVSFAVTELNPAVYKCVEIRNPSFGEHLRVANVEEPVYTGEYQRLMLVQASLGTGLSSALDALFDPHQARLQVVDFPAAHAGTAIAEHAEALAAQGRLLIGVMEHTGNSHIRKTQYVRQAQVQSGVEGAVEHLRRLRTVQTNQPILNPEPTYLPGVYSRALVITMDPAA